MWIFITYYANGNRLNVTFLVFFLHFCSSHPFLFSLHYELGLVKLGQTKISNQNFRLKTSLTLVSDETKIFVRYERKFKRKNSFDRRSSFVRTLKLNFSFESNERCIKIFVFQGTNLKLVLKRKYSYIFTNERKRNYSFESLEQKTKHKISFLISNNYYRLNVSFVR